MDDSKITTFIELPSNEGSEGLEDSWYRNSLPGSQILRNPTDVVMALWFTVIRIRELMQSSSQAAVNTNQTAGQLVLSKVADYAQST
jgi:hypothetical protein